MLAAYNQAVDAKADPASAGGPLSHVFRAFLIDRAGQVRNIYSLDFFDPKLVLNDVRTLLLEDGAGARSRRRSSHTNPPLPPQARDDGRRRRTAMSIMVRRLK